MQSKEFKKNNHFRNCADRNCYNCKHCWHNPNANKPGAYGEVSTYRSRMCWFDKSSPKFRFNITDFTVCDNWELDPHWNL